MSWFELLLFLLPSIHLFHLTILTKTPFNVCRHPEPFEILATPRSPECAELIRSVEVEQPWDAGDAESFVGTEWKKFAGLA